MSLIMGDTHGNYQKLKAFLEYKPEEEHILTGDLMDSHKASDELICRTFELFRDSSALSTVGNHDITYFHRCPGELSCSGHRSNTAFVHLINGSKEKFKGSFVRDGYIITHGGVVDKIGKRFGTLEALSDYINTEVDKVVYHQVGTVIDRPLSDVFWVSTARGGYNNYGGPLWADYRREKYDFSINQVFGHSHSDVLKMFSVSLADSKDKKYHVAVDCDEFWCFNTKTGEAEDFMPESIKNDPAARELLEVGY